MLLQIDLLCIIDAAWIRRVFLCLDLLGRSGFSASQTSHKPSSCESNIYKSDKLFKRHVGMPQLPSLHFFTLAMAHIIPSIAARYLNSCLFFPSSSFFLLFIFIYRLHTLSTQTSTPSHHLRLRSRVVLPQSAQVCPFFHRLHPIITLPLASMPAVMPHRPSINLTLAQPLHR